MPDPIAGKARSTGQAQLAVNEWQTDIWTIMDKITTQAMGPFASKYHMLLQQNLEDDDIIRIAGKYAGAWINRVITPDQILGRYNFKWTGALQLENQSIKTQQMVNFIKIYSTMPEEEKAKIKINWENYITKILRDGFMIKDVQNVIETDSKNMTVPPALEHKILDLGGELKVQESDDDNLHIDEHRKYINNTRDAYRKARMEQHIVEHTQSLEKKRIELAQIQAQQQMMLMAQQGGNTGKPEGNLGQTPESTNEDDLMRGQRVDG